MKKFIIYLLLFMFIGIGTCGAKQVLKPNMGGNGGFVWTDENDVLKPSMGGDGGFEWVDPDSTIKPSMGGDGGFEWVDPD
jgi:hypothetical protein